MTPPDTAACAFGDPTCPCQDGDVCHYVDDPLSETLAMTPPTTAARCSVCGDDIDEDRQVVTRMFRDGRFVGIRHDRHASPWRIVAEGFDVIEAPFESREDAEDCAAAWNLAYPPSDGYVEFIVEGAP